MKFIATALFASIFVFVPFAVQADTLHPVLPAVPFYSQFADISSVKWQKVGCGITSLAMLVGYYSKESVSVNTLLAEGIKAGAYSDAGWTYSGLIQVAKQHGLTGVSSNLSSKGASVALSTLTKDLTNGPVIASVHYKFEPKNPIPHLVVVNAIKNGLVYYNDPAAKSGQKTISVETFQAAWKMRYIAIRPKSGTLAFAKN
jgi:ABC-type bacteriocin/lantibiotic exporter with double-glycine peptidase domain